MSLPHYILNSSTYNNLLKGNEYSIENIEEIIKMIDPVFKNFTLTTTTPEEYISALKTIDYWNITDIPFSFYDRLKYLKENSYEDLFIPVDQQDGINIYSSDYNEFCKMIKDAENGTSYIAYLMKVITLPVQELANFAIRKQDHNLLQYTFTLHNSLNCYEPYLTEKIEVDYLIINIYDDGSEKYESFQELFEDQESAQKILSLLTNVCFNFIHNEQGVYPKLDLVYDDTLSTYLVKSSGTDLSVLFTQHKDMFEDERSFVIHNESPNNEYLKTLDMGNSTLVLQMSTKWKGYYNTLKDFLCITKTILPKYSSIHSEHEYYVKDKILLLNF